MTQGPDFNAIQAALAAFQLDEVQTLLQAAPASSEPAEQHQLAQFWNRLAILRLQSGEAKLALNAIDACAQIVGNRPALDINRGHAYLVMADWAEAEAAFRRVIDDAPGMVEGHLGLARLFWDLGDAESAIRNFANAIMIEPRHNDANRGYAYALLTLPGLTPEQLFAEHRAIAARMAPIPADGATPKFDSVADPDPDRQLRVGWVSTDFRNHPVGRNIMAEFQSRNRAQFHCICYADVARPDIMTDWFRSLADEWRDIRGLTDDAVAQLIRDDHIDVLVITAGRFDGNRPGVATFRPAPLQISYHDGATSGLDEMDAWVTDSVLHPTDTAEQFTEKLLRLPNFYFFEPPTGSPDVAIRPTDAAPVIAAFGNPAKISTFTLDLWASVLKEVPKATLLFKYRSLYATEPPRQRLKEMLLARGIGSERMTFLAGEADYRNHLAAYAQADLVLDCFPFTGANTTFEALWMGVPVVTMAGSSFISRVSTALLTAIGQEQLIAADAEAFIALATKLLENRNELARLRGTLRDSLQHSPIMNSRSHCAGFENAIREAWRAKCAAALRD